MGAEEDRPRPHRDHDSPPRSALHALIEVHGVRTLRREEVTVHDGLAVTTVARTLLDLADVLPEPALHSALEEAVSRRLFDRRAVVAVLARANGRRGTTSLRNALEILSERRPSPALSSSVPSCASVAHGTSLLPA